MISFIYLFKIIFKLINCICLIMSDTLSFLTQQLQGIKVSDKELPIEQYKDYIIKTVRNNQIVIIFGSTGSGKTTQIPQYLFEAGINNDKTIGVTQPRRIAAINMASRVAQEMRSCLGMEVGYEVRFNKKSSNSTKIKYMTDGILLNQCLEDPKLPEYGVLMIDEAHERTVDTDVLLGLIKILASRRTDLKVLITSATIICEKFSNYFSGAPVISFDGKMYDVQIIYEPMWSWSLYFITNIVQKIHNGIEKGDILLFLTGQEDIEECCQNLESIQSLTVLPLYGALDFDAQQDIFKPAEPGKRKVIVSTNIAETSITIDGIRFVIDCGYVKQNLFDSRSGIDSLTNVRISQDQAIQRKGRAGRTNTGWCYRLYTEETYRAMKQETTPEIYRRNLYGTYLKIAGIGIDPMSFKFIDSPEHETLRKCLSELQDLDLIDEFKKITELGKSIQDFPVEPKIGKALFASSKYFCITEVITIMAMMSERNVFIRPKKSAVKSDYSKQKFFSSEGDQFMYLNAYKAWSENRKSKQWCYDNFVNFKTMEQIDLVRTQLMGLVKRKFPNYQDSDLNLVDSIKKSLIPSFYKNICFRKSKGIYINYLNQQVLYMHPSSCLMNTFSPLILYYEVVQTKKPYMRGIMTLSESLLTEFPKESKKIGYNSSISL